MGLGLGVWEGGGRGEGEKHGRMLRIKDPQKGYTGNHTIL